MTPTHSRALPKSPHRLLLALPLMGLLVMVPRLALAHVGAQTDTGFGAGLGHPFGGADHILAMVAVGLWAALSGGRALWAMPAAFLIFMLAGGILGATGRALPGVEPMILASIMVLGAAAGMAWRPPLILALAGIAAFGAAHGFAHGAEGSAGFGFAVGFLLSTAALHIAGLAVGFGLVKSGQIAAARAAGGGAALAGLVMAFG